MRKNITEDEVFDGIRSVICYHSMTFNTPDNRKKLAHDISTFLKKKLRPVHIEAYDDYVNVESLDPYKFIKIFYDDCIITSLDNYMYSDLNEHITTVNSLIRDSKINKLINDKQGKS